MGPIKGVKMGQIYGVYSLLRKTIALIYCQLLSLAESYMINIPWVNWKLSWEILNCSGG